MKESNEMKRRKVGREEGGRGACSIKLWNAITWQDLASFSTSNILKFTYLKDFRIKYLKILKL